MEIYPPKYLNSLIPGKFRQAAEVNRLAEEYYRNQVVFIEDFFEPGVFHQLKSHVASLLEYAVRKDFLMANCNTPRNMSVVSGRDIFAHSNLLSALYSSYPVVNFIAQIVGKHLHLSGQDDAFMAINHLHRKHDTQGWHLDDGEPVVVYAIENCGCGGDLEYIPNWSTVKKLQADAGDTTIPVLADKAVKSGLAKTISMSANSMYLLKADDALHRVTPLESEKSRRTVIAVGYEAYPVNSYSNTGSDLYNHEPI